MAESLCLCLLMEKEGLSIKLEQLSRLELDHAQTPMQTSRYPDRYISVWNFVPYQISSAELHAEFRRIEQGQETRLEAVGFHIGTSAEGSGAYTQAPPGGFVDQRIGIGFIQSFQGIFGNPETDVLLEVGWNDNHRSFRQHYHQARVLMQKQVEVLEPKYGWVMTEDMLAELARTQASKFPEPWRLYSPTRVVGSWLLNELKIQIEEFLTAADFYDVKLLGSVVWLAEPTGLGNEQPYRFAFPFVRPVPPPPSLVAAIPHWWMHCVEYEDEALQKTLQDRQVAHDRACNRIFGSNDSTA